VVNRWTPFRKPFTNCSAATRQGFSQPCLVFDLLTAMADPPRFRRVHHTGTEALIREHADAWQIRIDLKEAGHSAMTIVGFLAPTVEQAKKLADQEVFKHGHVCTAACKGWRKV
jgi:hypothetical protein